MIISTILMNYLPYCVSGSMGGYLSRNCLVEPNWWLIYGMFAFLVLFTYEGRYKELPERLEKADQKKYGVLFLSLRFRDDSEYMVIGEKVRLRDAANVTMFYGLFMARRILFAIILQLSTDMVKFQLIIVLQLLWILYLLMYWPF